MARTRALASEPVMCAALARVRRRASMASRLSGRTAPRLLSRRQWSWESASPNANTLGQRAAAAAALPRRAAVAMPSHDDGVAAEVHAHQLAQVDAFLRGALAPAQPERQAEHLVEVAVVDVALPVHADQPAAHHAPEVLVSV